VNDLPSSGEDPGEVRRAGIGDVLDRLSRLAQSARCPICERNVGWSSAPGIERVILKTTATETIEAVPYACTWCGFLRMHVIRIAPPEEITEPHEEPSS